MRRNDTGNKKPRGLKTTTSTTGIGRSKPGASKPQGWARITEGQIKKGTSTAKMGRTVDAGKTVGEKNKALEKKETKTHIIKKKKTKGKTHLSKKKLFKMHLKEKQNKRSQFTRDTKKKKTSAFGNVTESEQLEDNAAITPAKFSSNDYTKKYLEKKRLKTKEASGETDTQKAEIIEHNKREAINKRARAQWLFQQVALWKSKLGTGEYPDAVVLSNIAIYENEYYSINQQHRPY